MATISMAPSKSFNEAAMERQGIAGVSCKDDGTIALIDTESAFKSLLGTVIADDTFKNLIIPSHLRALERAVEELKRLKAHTHAVGALEILEIAIDDIQGVITTLSKDN